MSWTINGTDPRTLGLIISDITGWLDAPALSYQAITVPGRPGQLIINPTADVAPVRNVARGIVEGTDLTTSRANFDKLKALFASVSGVAVGFLDGPGRAVTAYCTRFAALPGAAQMISRKIAVEIELVAFDPYEYDTSATTVALTAVAAALGLGTAPVRPVITITGAATNPVFTLKNSAGTAIGSLALALTTVAGDSLVIDCAKRTVRLNGVNRLDAVTGGDFFTLDAIAQGVYSSSSWPTLTVAGLGAGTAAAVYKKAWR